MRLLYVEDDRISTIVFQESLKLYGLTDLRIAETCEEGIAIASEWSPEVLVIDANLPDCTGIAMLHRLRALPGLADAPAFMCSANSLPEDVRAAFDAGFDGYWTKPIDIACVIADLSALAGRPGRAVP